MSPGIPKAVVLLSSGDCSGRSCSRRRVSTTSSFSTNRWSFTRTMVVYGTPPENSSPSNLRGQRVLASTMEHFSRVYGKTDMCDSEIGDKSERTSIEHRLVVSPMSSSSRVSLTIYFCEVNLNYLGSKTWLRSMPGSHKWTQGRG